MPHSLHVAQYTRDDHLRLLLDQRNARADVHGRFSAISEYSDTPSVYSRPYFSPKPSDNGDHHTDNTVYDYAHPPSPSHLRSSDNRRHDPASSMLDLEYDPRSSHIPSESHEDEQLAYEDDGDDVELSRMSYLGPKMRVHSRAPWEMDGDTLDEEGEEDDSSRHFSPGFPFSRVNGSKSNAAGPSSPRPSNATSRPSGESSRSQVPPKRSFETINSQISYPRGALYALAQESMSATSLGRFPGPPKEILRSKISLGRLRSDTPTGPLPPLPLPSAHNYSTPAPTFEASFRNGVNFPVSYKPHSTSDHTPMHPYANPDLVVSYAEDEPPHSTDNSNYPPSRNDSSVTITDSFSTDSMIKSSARSTLTPDTSVNSMLSKHRASSILMKNISSPVPVVNSQGTELPASDHSLDHSTIGLPPNVANLPGWTERNTAPSFSLISLEEARAQRVRNPPPTQESRISSASATSNTSASILAAEVETSSVVQVIDASPAGTISSRARGRSISAGAKARNAIQTIVGQPKADQRNTELPSVAQPLPVSMPVSKTLKHKKSGFMRLFNGNKVQEKEERGDPPPVPALPDSESLYQSVQRTPRSNVQRIPVPSLSPSLVEVASNQASDTPSESPSWKVNLLSAKRTPPMLSINTVPTGSSRASTSAVIDRDNQTYLEPMPRPWSRDQQPQSAPAHVTEFPALRLRPVSTLFSAHFGDHIVTSDSRSSDETTDVETPSSPNGLISPITPASFTRTGNDKIAVTSPSTDDQAIIKDLQKQMASAKLAWQRHIWELEGQVRDLKAELEETKGKFGDEHCATCGRGKKKTEFSASLPVAGGVVNRPRARTGTSSRFTNAHS